MDALPKCPIFISVGRVRCLGWGVGGAVVLENPLLVQFAKC